MFHRLSFAIVAAVVPLAVAAQVSNVTGIHAEYANGTVVVSWQPAEGDVKKYRIFYSHASILEQGGLYDDYEDADGDTTSHVLATVPAVDKLYVSVLAVGQDDAESPYFTEEDVVDIAGSADPLAVPTAASSSSVADFPPSPTVAMQSQTLQLLTAVSTSSTGVTLTFTHELSIPEQYKNEAFSIKTGSGTPLAVVRYRLVGNQALLDTEEQTPGRVYQVTIHGSIAGKAADGGLVPQEAGTAPLLFTGLQVDGSIPEVSNLTLTVKGRNVEATWTAPAATVKELQISQSINGGRTFGPATRLDKNAKGVTIPNVQNGAFTLRVRTVALDGSLSRGVQQTVMVGPAAAGSSSSAVSSKPATTSSAKSSSSTPVSAGPRPDGKPGTLPSSGLGLMTVVSLSGGITGLRFFRRKNATKA
jgi:hypothetical protein